MLTVHSIFLCFLAIYRLSTAYYVDKRHFIVNLFKEVCWHNGEQGNVANSKRIKFKRLLCTKGFNTYSYLVQAATDSTLKILIKEPVFVEVEQEKLVKHK